MGKDSSSVTKMLEHAVWVLQEQLRMFANEDEICISDIEQLVYDLRGELYSVSPKSHIFSGGPPHLQNELCGAFRPGHFRGVATVEYYEGLIDFLDDMVPCLDDLIEQYDEGASQ